MFSKEADMKIKFEYEGQKRAILMPQPVKYQQLIEKLRQLCNSVFTIEYSAAEGQFVREIECQEDLDDVINLTKSPDKMRCLPLKLVPCSIPLPQKLMPCASESKVSWFPLMSSGSLMESGGFFHSEVPEPFQVSGLKYSVNSSSGSALPSFGCRNLLDKRIDYIPESDQTSENHSDFFVPDSSDFKSSEPYSYNERKMARERFLNSSGYSTGSSSFCPSILKLNAMQSNIASSNPENSNQVGFSAFPSVRNKHEAGAVNQNQFAYTHKDRLSATSGQQTYLEDAVLRCSDKCNQEIRNLEKEFTNLGKDIFIPRRWLKGKLLGRGAFGQVFTGYDIDQGIEFAIKQVHIYSQSSEVVQQIKALEMEISVLQGIHHKHVVEYYGMLREEDCLSIFIEFIPMGSLKDHINRYGCLTETVTSLYTQQILKGLAYLHSKMIVHRDVKCANVLRDHRGNLKLGDFGAAKLLQSQSIAETSKIAGTPYFMAPEIIRAEACGFQSDIWSLGCTVVEMLTKNPPWHQYDSIAAIYKIGSTWPPEYSLPDSASNRAKSFLDLCFTEVASRRPKAQDLLTHCFIASNAQREIPQNSPEVT